MFYLFLRQRETEDEQGRGRERRRHRSQSRLQALSCQHRARHGAQTHKLRDHDLSQSWTLNPLSHPGTHIRLFKDIQFSFLNIIFRRPKQAVHVLIGLFPFNSPERTVQMLVLENQVIHKIVWVFMANVEYNHSVYLEENLTLC